MKEKQRESAMEDGPLVESDPLADVVGMVDTKLQEEGDWFGHASPHRDEVAPNEIEGFRHLLLDAKGNGLRRVQVASTRTKAYKKDLESVTRRAFRMAQRERESFQQEMRPILLAKHCVKDWDFTSRRGEPIPCEREIVQRILSEREYENHQDFITVAISMLEGRIARNREEDEGN